MSPRLRVLVVVAVCVIAAAGAAVAVAFNGRGPGGQAEGPREGNPPLALDVALDDPRTARALVEAERLYNDGRLEDARIAFDAILVRQPDLLEARVGDAVARWPAGTVARLRGLLDTSPESALVRLHLGLALFWERQDGQAVESWQAALEVEPDSPAALRAENLLHPDMPLFRPIFVPDLDLPAEAQGKPLGEQLGILERRATASDSADDWLIYGTALQRASRPISAEEAFGRAVGADPARVDAQVARIVAQFTKDDPSASFSQLGPLAGQHPDEPVIRYHLGLMLLWLRQVTQAETELEQARDAAPGTFYAQQAQTLLDRLRQVAAGADTGPADTGEEPAATPGADTSAG
ncbi:MAG: hypothetical protein R3C15_04815 [Thermoleophilia bacterium]